MSDSSGSALDLLVAPLPLTSKHRDELDEAILKRVSDLLDEIPDLTHIEVTMGLSDWTCRLIVMDIIQETSYFLKRENLKNVLRVDIDMKNERILQKHPQLRDIILQACQTRSNFTRIVDLSEFDTRVPPSGSASESVLTSCLRNISDIRIGQCPHTPDSRSEGFDSVACTFLSFLASVTVLDEDQPAFLYESFVRPYVGKAVDGFYQYLKSNNEKFRGRGLERPYYAKFCSIVQSSGTGKSRLMTEVSLITVLSYQAAKGIESAPEQGRSRAIHEPS
jgi:hypothetical protein